MRSEQQQKNTFFRNVFWWFYISGPYYGCLTVGCSEDEMGWNNLNSETKHSGNDSNQRKWLSDGSNQWPIVGSSKNIICAITFSIFSDSAFDTGFVHSQLERPHWMLSHVKSICTHKGQEKPQEKLNTCR